MSELTAWQSGERCEKHDMMYCADCLEQGKLRRDDDGNVVYQNDCAVETFMEITGTKSYEVAAAVLKSFGYNPSYGAPADSLKLAFASAGYRVRDVTRLISYDSLAHFSTQGRKFFVTGRKGKKGHAWTIIDGKENRPYHSPFRYNAYEVKKEN